MEVYVQCKSCTVHVQYTRYRNLTLSSFIKLLLMVRCSSFLQQQSTLYRRWSTLLLLLGAVVSFTVRSPQWLSVDSSSYSYIRRRLTYYTSSSADSRRTYRSDVRARLSILRNEDKSALLIDSPRRISTDDEEKDHSTEGVSVIDCFNIVNADGSDVDASIASQRFAIDPSLLGFLLLNAVAVLWGSQHVVIKASVDSYPTTSLVNFWRFLLSTLLFSPSLVKLLVGSTTLTIYDDHGVIEVIVTATVN